MRPSISTLILSLQGVVLGLGAASALFVSQFGLGARLGLSRSAVEWSYAFGSAGLVALAALLLTAARITQRWPFPPEDVATDEQPPNGAEVDSHRRTEPAARPGPANGSPWARYGATLLAGLGTGAYAGLLNHLDWGPIHLATAIAYFGLIPLAILCIVLGERSFGPTFARLVVLMSGVELAAQLALWWGRDRAYFDDLTRIDLGVLAAGILVANLVAAARFLRKRRESSSPVRTAADRAPS